MKCPNCGTENKDDSVFCENCGVKLENVSASPVSETPAESAVPASEEAPVSEAPAKKSGSKLPLIIGGVAVVGVAAFAATQLLAPKREKFFDVQGQAIQTAYVDPFKVMFDPKVTDFSSDLTLTADYSMIPEFSEFLKKTAIVAKLDSSKDTALMNAALQYNGSDVLSAALFTDGKMISVASPSLNDKVYTGDVIEITKNLTGNTDNTFTYDNMKELQLSEEKQKEIAKRYRDVLVKALTDKNLTIEKNQKIDLSVSPITNEDAKNALDGKSFVKYTFAPSEEDYKALMKNLTETLEKDTDLKNWYDKYQSFEKMSIPNMPTYDEILTKMKENTDEVTKSLTDSNLKWTVYADDKTAHYITIEAGSKTVALVFAENNGQVIDLINADQFTFSNIFTKNGSLCSGTMSFDKYALDYHDVDTSKASKLGLFYGNYSCNGVTLDVTAADNASDYKIQAMGLTVNLNATDKSTAEKPSGTEVDITNYTAEDYQKLAQELSADFATLLQSNASLMELVSDLSALGIGGMF